MSDHTHDIPAPRDVPVHVDVHHLGRIITGPCQICDPDPVTRDELIARAQAHIDGSGRLTRRVLTMRHYRQVVGICRINGLATDDEIAQAAGLRQRVIA